MARQARHYYSREALATRVDYVESRLDESVNSLKEAVKEIKESLAKSEIDRKEEMKKMDLRRKEENADFKDALEKVVARAESSRRWSIGIVISIAIAVIGFMLMVTVFLLTNGFQVPT